MSARERHPVVVAVDGTPGSEGALRYAVDEAARAGDELHVVHVTPVSPPEEIASVAWSDLRATGRAVLERATASAHDLVPDVEITSELVVGSRVMGILAALRSGRLLVVGRSSQGRVHLPGGGTPAALAARARCPVVIVPSDWVAGVTRKDVVVAMKSRAHARELLSHAFAIAAERDARVVVVTAWALYDPTMDRHEVRDHADDWETAGRLVLEGLVEPWRTAYPSVPVELRVIHGSGAKVLEQQSADADLLLMARPVHIVPPHGRLGSTGHRLLRTSRCPVQVVPEGVVVDAHPVAPAVLRAT